MFNIALKKNFDVYIPQPLKWEKGKKNKSTLFTAYYSPIFHGSKIKTKEFKNPIYAKPTSTKLAKSTSDQINYDIKIKKQLKPLFYVKESLYDVWLLHVEGGGKVRVKNKNGSHSDYYLSYDGDNGKSFKMLYKLSLIHI